MSRYISMIAAAVMLFATGAFADDGHAGAEMGHDAMARRSGPQLIMPMMNATRGRALFAAKGCVACHSINGVGGEDAPSPVAGTGAASGTWTPAAVTVTEPTIPNPRWMAHIYL